MSSDWRSVLTPEDAFELKALDIAIQTYRDDISDLQKDRKAIINRTVQRNKRHLKKGVDTVSEKA